MDGLLIDTVPCYVTAMVQAGTDVGRPVTADYVLSLVGLLGAELESRMSADLGAEFPMRAYFAAMSARLEPLLSAGVPLKSGARELLDALAARRMPLAVATSMKHAEATMHLGRCGIRPFFQHVVARDDVARGKPYPDVHIAATERLRVTSRDCLVLEDSANGIRAAHAAGAMPVMVPDVVAPTDEIRALCIAVASSLFEVKTMLSVVD